MSVKKKSIHPGQAVAFALQLTFTFIDSKERKRTSVSLSLSFYTRYTQTLNSNFLLIQQHHHHHPVIIFMLGKIDFLLFEHLPAYERRKNEFSLYLWLEISFFFVFVVVVVFQHVSVFVCGQYVCKCFSELLFQVISLFVHLNCLHKSRRVNFSILE